LSFVLVPNTSVSVNNGANSRNCIIEFSSEASSSEGDTLGVGYALDSPNSSGCQVSSGPLSFHVGNHFETHTAV
jgi:hypothetical protein